MARFKFLHAADLHLDSPLLGLTVKSPDFARGIAEASRRAFDNLVALAIAEDCRFVVLAGDVFDGDVRDFHTHLYFLSGMRRLAEAGLRVFLIAGNHDAENRFADKLTLSENVHRFGHRKAETAVIAELDVAIHGRSFGQREVLDNIALGYPPPLPGHFNIGVLHTALAGREGEHAAYAPCTLEQLVNHGYGYWALGHIHVRAELGGDPPVVYPGNLQGRNPRETGPKGASVVTVADGRVEGIVHHDLDEVRWATETVDVSAAADRDGVLLAMRERLQPLLAGAGERPLALRLRLAGRSPLHGTLLRDRAGLREEVEALFAAVSDRLWLEKLEIGTAPPTAPAAAIDPTVAGQLAAELRSAGAGEALEMRLAALIDEIRVKMPPGARPEVLFAALRGEVPARAVDLALALVAEAEAGLAAD